MADEITIFYGSTTAAASAVVVNVYRWTSANVWSSRTSGPTPARYRHGGCNFGEGFGVAVAGFNISSANINDVDKFSMVGNSWSSETNFPVSMRSSGLELLEGDAQILSISGQSDLNTRRMTIADSSWSTRTVIGDGLWGHMALPSTVNGSIIAYRTTTSKRYVNSANTWSARATAVNSNSAPPLSGWRTTTHLLVGSLATNQRYSVGGDTWSDRVNITGTSGTRTNQASNEGETYASSHGGSSNAVSKKIDDTANTESTLASSPANICGGGPAEYILGVAIPPAVVAITAAIMLDNTEVEAGAAPGDIMITYDFNP